jgi:hypothetical protein
MKKSDMFNNNPSRIEIYISLVMIILGIIVLIVYINNTVHYSFLLQTKAGWIAPLGVGIIGIIRSIIKNKIMKISLMIFVSVLSIMGILF